MLNEAMPREEKKEDLRSEKGNRKKSEEIFQLTDVTLNSLDEKEPNRPPKGTNAFYQENNFYLKHKSASE